jgi:hypothetical protein
LCRHLRLHRIQLCLRLRRLLLCLRCLLLCHLLVRFVLRPCLLMPVNGARRRC